MHCALGNIGFDAKCSCRFSAECGSAYGATGSSLACFRIASSSAGWGRTPPASSAATDAALPQYGVIYDNGPYNGTTDAWTINFGFAVSDSFTSGTITGLHFVYWDASITDLLTSVDMAVSTTSFGGTFQTSTGVINTFLGVNQYGYNLYQADVTFSGMTGAGYITLQNACSTSGCSTVNPIYWDENSGPSTAYESSIGSIPSEAFTLTGGGGCSTDLPASGQSLKAQLQHPDDPSPKDQHQDSS